MALIHTTVLLHESIDGLNLHKGSIYLDGTLGSGGHSEYALEKGATVIGLDQDLEAIERSKKRLKGGTFIQENYRNLDIALASLKIAKIDAFMLDLGLSSDQFETSGRGFTFQKDEPLLMTFKKNVTEEDLTASEIVNTWDEANIADIIYGYGDERYSRRIAKSIVESRPIKTTFELVEAIKLGTPNAYHRGRIHPATRTFQALRITVNDEINTLKEGLRKGFEALNPGGRMAVISFHSIEDRVTKRFFKEKQSEATILTKKPIVPSDEEKVRNPRSRSAKLRIIEKKI
ncbi:MAG: 16S rRNA (cytosine(1402)-N(4))-methyltransferase RsmH [Candidatus Pacebacteria bacterium]|jgi:16S rRNA (cytosine1402-N4)-methyltransferase|nr:16S rRNA (cytosine(1402)-N(4))-methyltransferase RsmH [Candidatus Paceibacterota bacterium]